MKLKQLGLLRGVLNLLKNANSHFNQTTRCSQGLFCLPQQFCPSASSRFFPVATHSAPNKQEVHRSALEDAPSVHVSADNRLCNIRWDDGFQAKFHSSWLRQNCQCKDCRHENGQRLFNPPSGPVVSIENLEVNEDHVKIEWHNEKDHESILQFSYLRENNYTEETLLRRREEVKLNEPTIKIPTITYDEIKSSKQGFLKWLRQINEKGLSIVEGVPTEKGNVRKVSELIGPVIYSIYGEQFDVEAVPDPINVAYSSEYLEPHMDLVYFESPPGLQSLHCLRFDSCVTGGESTFLDVFHVAEQFRTNYPDLFDILTKIPATFQKVHYNRDLPVHIVNQKPHIKLNHKKDIVAVYWAPAFEGPLAVSEDDVEDYYKAYHKFAKCVLDSPNFMTTCLKEGELVIFNNIRMLHGRNAFQTNGGARHLEGCYVNIDLYKSKTQTSLNLYGDGRRAKRVGNQCWS